MRTNLKMNKGRKESRAEKETYCRGEKEDVEMEGGGECR